MIIQGTLQPTTQEQLSKTGHATIKLGLWTLMTGTVGEKEEYSVEANGSEIIVRYKGRTVTYSIVDLVRDAVTLTNEKALAQQEQGKQSDTSPALPTKELSN